MFEFKELEYVISVAKHQNITKAAEELYISQPSLSKYIKKLEMVLGVSLFSKVGNRFILTYAGEMYLRNAQNILLIKNKITAEIDDIRKINKGRFNLSIPSTRGSYLIPETLPKFKEMYPNVEINLFENSSSEAEKLLLNGEADIAIFNHHTEHPDLEYKVIGVEELILAVSPDNPLANMGEKKLNCKYDWIDIKLFKNENFILNFPYQRTGKMAEKIFKSANFEPNAVLRTRSMECAVRLTLSNYGVCFVSDNYLKYMNLLTKPKYFSIGYPTTTFKLVVAYRKGSYLPRYIKDYIDIVKDFVNF
ncbi:LysR family transcriptional regulator [Romboutsia sp. Marseille-P6047]|uniref:LysR family transcriptional regulator n=1 Tax=Romboutsia sp. Marseille-P6047 TaxID=2161817 RepID=UPI000F054A47|nr:LysR family transcriptional regulator [Romboutsia sp. Marseille-P6047]